MKVTLPTGTVSTSTQPAAATLAAANNGRVELNITLTAAGAAAGPYFIKRGAGASATNWDFQLSDEGDNVSIANYLGLISVSPVPASGNIQVSELV